MTGLIVCARTADLIEPYGPAIRAICAWCDSEIWLGDAVRRDVPLGTPICDHCASNKLAPGDAIVIPPSVRREAAELMRKRKGKLS